VFNGLEIVVDPFDIDVLTATSLNRIVNPNNKILFLGQRLVIKKRNKIWLATKANQRSRFKAR